MVTATLARTAGSDGEWDMLMLPTGQLKRDLMCRTEAGAPENKKPTVLPQRGVDILPESLGSLLGRYPTHGRAPPI